MDPFIDFKRRAAHAFLDAGYSVAWSPDKSDWLDVYQGRPELGGEMRAEISLVGAGRPSLPGYNRLARLCIYHRRLVKLLRTPVERFRPVQIVREEEMTAYFNSDEPALNALDRSGLALALHEEIREILE